MTIDLPEDDWTTLLDALGDHCDELAAEVQALHGARDDDLRAYFRAAQRVRETLLAAMIAAPDD